MLISMPIILALPPVSNRNVSSPISRAIRLASISRAGWKEMLLSSPSCQEPALLISIRLSQVLSLRQTFLSCADLLLWIDSIPPLNRKRSTSKGGQSMPVQIHPERNCSVSQSQEKRAVESLGTENCERRKVHLTCILGTCHLLFPEATF